MPILDLPRPHLGQRMVKAEARRFNAACMGRRWGKTTLGMDILIPLGMRRPVGWFSPTYKMISDVWRAFVQVLRPVTAHINTQEKRIETIYGGTFDFWSLDTPDVARGRKYTEIVVDEAAMIVDLQEAWGKVLRPTLADYVGGAWFLSTPKGLNYFHDLYQMGQDPENHDWASWQLPTNSNPFILQSEVDAMSTELPEQTYAQEILAQFIGDGGGVFRRVLEAATATPQERAIPGHQYVFGADWARSRDYTVLSVLDVTLKAFVHIDRFNMLDYMVQAQRTKALYDRFRPRTIIAEQNSIGIAVIEQLIALRLPVEPFNTTNQSKKDAIEHLQNAFERSVVTIIKDPVLMGELMAYESKRTASGLIVYNAPSGQHDDCVMSVALAWEGANRAMPSMPIAGGQRTIQQPWRP